MEDAIAAEDAAGRITPPTADVGAAEATGVAVGEVVATAVPDEAKTNAGTLFVVAGTGPWSMRSACTTSSALNCWPTPALPSYPPVHQVEPQAVPELPPVQLCAAATEVLVRRPMT